MSGEVIMVSNGVRSMLFKLYEIYLQRSGADETFDQFIYWGEMLLGDFDDIDKYMNSLESSKQTFQRSMICCFLSFISDD